MGRLRTKEAARLYKKAIAEGALDNGCRLCQMESVKEFRHWRVITNEFPYDLIAKKHDMIVPKRHVRESGLSNEERKEFAEIKDTYLHEEYEYIIEATYRQKSIPDHFHFHIIVAKD